MSLLLTCCDDCESEVEVHAEDDIIYLELPNVVAFVCNHCGSLCEQHVGPRTVQHLLACGVVVDVE